MKAHWRFGLFVLLSLSAGCGGGSMTPTQPPAINAQVQLSYWVDYWLAHMFPASSGANMLQSTNSDDGDIEVLAAQNADGSVVIMVANHALNSSTDNNGTGAPRTINIDVSALGSFPTGSLLTIDANTNITAGPTASSVSPSSQMTASLNGYGVALLTLK
jgi:hypothetical protein